MNRCLLCYEQTGEGEKYYHPACINRSFLKRIDPVVPYRLSEIRNLAVAIIKSSFSVTGVQPKISLGESSEKGKSKLTIVGYKSLYILKPPSETYRELPENEDLTMKLAEASGIKTVKHALVPMLSGETAYLTLREDRGGDEKIHMEDMAQITGRLTEHKYRGSVEKIGKQIYIHSENKMFDVISFFELLLFCFLTGNSDMHLKNYSLILNGMGYNLAPACDLLNTRIITEDAEESALTINGKKNKITIDDFEKTAAELNIPKKSRENIYRRFSEIRKEWISISERSLLLEDLKRLYIEYFRDAGARLFG